VQKTTLSVPTCTPLPVPAAPPVANAKQFCLVLHFTGKQAATLHSITTRRVNGKGIAQQDLLFKKQQDVFCLPRTYAGYHYSFWHNITAGSTLRIQAVWQGGTPHMGAGAASVQLCTSTHFR
jgi:hypothetical protein